MEAFSRMLVLALGLFLCFAAAVSGANTTFKKQNCSANDGSYGIGDYSKCVDFVIEAMTTVTANSPHYEYSIQCPFQVTQVAYGKSKCNPSLTVSDCVTCLGIVKANIQLRCPNSMVVTMEFEDCSMQYAPYPM